VSARSDSTESYFSNFLHPTAGGYEQLADAYYSHIRHLMDDYVAACSNQLVNSYNISTPTGWSDADAYYSTTPGQDDPHGGTNATLCTYVAETEYAYQIATNVTANTEDIVVSAWIKNGDQASTELFGVRLLDTSDNAYGEVRARWNATPPNISTVGTLVTATGIETLSDGWYRMWMHMNIGAGRSGNAFSLRISPSETTPVIGSTVYFGGAQIEFDRTTWCGEYVETP